MKFNNPVLKGFNPDPCLCRKDNDYYLATSTFEWYPGVQIYHSRDLINWEFVSRPLTSPDYLDISQVPASGGIWAPCLSYCGADQSFYLVYTQVNQFEKASAMNHGFKDTHNFLIHSKDIEGPWSKPVYLNSSGFDPSLFYDDDGKKYLLNMRWDYRPGNNNFSGILLQEYSNQQQKLIGEVTIISSGTEIGCTEGPHLYKRNNWYYLVLAEGGTSFLHSVTIARSRDILGPYEFHPSTPFLTQVQDRIRAALNSENPLPFCKPGIQKTGHASLCPIDDEHWCIAFLCARPSGPIARCPLGREVALATIIWNEEGWPEFEETVADIVSINEQTTSIQWKEDFNSKEINWQLQFLRKDWSNDATFKVKGFLTIMGGESPASVNQRVIARRIDEFKWIAETCMVFHPYSFQQLAGLVIRYNEANQYYLAASLDDNHNKIVAVHSFNRKQYSMSIPQIINHNDPLYLRARCDGYWIRFYISQDHIVWTEVGDGYDFTLLSDDYCQPLGFTGAFVGLACNDMEKRAVVASFDYLSYTAPIE